MLAFVSKAVISFRETSKSFLSIPHCLNKNQVEQSYKQLLLLHYRDIMRLFSSAGIK